MSVTNNFTMIIDVLLLSSLLASSNGLLKWSAQHVNDEPFSILSKHSLGIGASLGIYGVVMLLYIYVLRSQDITKLYPAYTGLSILLVLLIGVIFFHEKLAKLQISGCLLIIAGVYLIGK